MTFVTRRYSVGPSDRCYGVTTSNTDDTPDVSIDLSGWNPYEAEPAFIYMTESEAQAICALMNQLFARTSVVELLWSSKHG
jgi:hypothetical protein